MLKLLSSLVLFLMLASHAQAETQSNLTHFDDKLTIKLLILGPFSDLEVQRPGKTVDQMLLGTGNSLSYYPNVGGLGSFDISYKGFGLQYSMNLAKTYSDSQAGKTNMQDIQLYYYGENVGIDFYYQRVKGYYLNEPEKHGKTNNPFPQMPNLLTNYLGLNFYYIFSPEKFSFKAAFNQSEKQRKSGGSFLAVLSPGYLSVSNSQSLILPSEETLYKDDAGFRKGAFIGMALSAGYAYTFILSENFFITVMYTMGIGAHYHQYSCNLGTEKGFSLLYKDNFRLGVGYNGEEHLFGISFIGDGTEYKIKDASIAYLAGRGEAYYGRRF